MTKSYSKIKKLNNSGSTLVMTLLVITFISLLASVILAAAVNNVIMKRIDYNSKDTFYTAESVLDEIKVGVGNDSLNAMANAYEDTLTNLIVTDGSLDFMLTNDEANAKMQAYFMDEMTKKLTNGAFVFSGSTFTDKYEYTEVAEAKTYLEKFINKEDYENQRATIKSIDSITFIKDYNGIKNEIIVNNVVINYKTEKVKDTYFANVTVDLNISYPNMTIDFSSSKRLEDFKEFALISDKNIQLTASTENISATVNAGIYAGENIEISSGAGGIGSLSVGAYTDSDGNSKTSNVVARGDILLTGSESSGAIPGNVAKLSLSTTDLWVTNIETGTRIAALDKDITAGAEITIGSDCNSFVADDLNITGKNSIVNIGGNYYGYSYDGYNADNKHTLSSSIIVSGAGSVLNLGSDVLTLKKLVIAGHSYVVYGDSSIPYKTGESLSFKPDQELYLVPSDYIGIEYEKSVANPMPKDVWDALNAAAAVVDSEVKVVDMSGFFAMQEGLLNATAPYTEKIDGEMVYLYLNFKDTASSAVYMQGLISGKAPELANKLDEYTNALLTTGVVNSGLVNIQAESMYASGVLMETMGGSVDLSYGGDTSVSELGINATDYKNRYKIMTQLLASIPWEADGARYVVNNIDEALEKHKEYYVTGSQMTDNATYNIVDWDLVASNQYNASESQSLLLKGHAYTALTLTKVVTNNAYVVPSYVQGGIIIAKGDVTLDHDFTGMIISQGNIIIKNNETITTNDAMIESLIMNEYKLCKFTDLFNDTVIGSTEDEPFRNYLVSYKSTGADGSEEVKVEALEYDDIISLDNWRKYDDGTTVE